MKEIAASAAALAGLLAFAYVSQQPVSTRNKRAAITIDETEELDGGFTASLESFQNLTNEQASALWLDLTGEDVTQKQAVNRNDKVRYNQIGALHNTMNEAWVKRWNKGRSYLRGMAPQHGNCENPKFIRKSTCDDTVCKNEPENCFDYEQTRRADEFLSEDGYDAQVSGSEVFNKNDGLGDINNFYYVVPRAIPLNSADRNQHVRDYNNYLNGFYRLRSEGHFPNEMALSYVIWQNGAASAPKNLKYRGQLPFSRMNRFWKNPGQLTNQPFLEKSVEIFHETILGRQSHNQPDNTAPSYGPGARNCFVLWFHQDMPVDIKKFTANGVGADGRGGNELVHETLSRCTYAHAFVLPEFNGFDPSSAREDVRKVHAAITGTSSIAVSDDFSGRFILNSYDEINSSEFHNRVMRYFALAKRRRLCTVHGNAWVQPTDEDLFGATEDYSNLEQYIGEVSEVFEATETPGVELEEGIEETNYELESYELASGDIYYDQMLLGAGEEATAVKQEDNHCCGAGPDSMPYNLYGEKSCCYDHKGLGGTDPYGLSPHLTQGCEE